MATWIPESASPRPGAAGRSFGLAGVGLVGLVIAHVYFAVRPEKWWITKSMILGWITRRQYLEHHEPSRWPVTSTGRPAANAKPAGQA